MANKFNFSKDNFKKIVIDGRMSATEDLARKSKLVYFTIAGSGTLVAVKNKAGENVADTDGEVLNKMIFNTNLNSGIALNNADVKAAYKAAIQLSKDGKDEEAHAAFQAVANKLQVSFNVIINDGSRKMIDQLGNRVDCSGKLQLIETESGKIVTIDPKTIKVLEPEVLTAEVPTGWDDEDETSDGPTVEETTDAATALSEA